VPILCGHVRYPKKGGSKPPRSGHDLRFRVSDWPCVGNGAESSPKSQGSIAGVPLAFCLIRAETALTACVGHGLAP
jgi:hypothetical protein